ncbi:small toxic inner membrane protein TimP, partial [Escherichia coli]
MKIRCFCIVLIVSGALFSQVNNNRGNDSNLLIVFYVQIMPDDFVMQ